MQTYLIALPICVALPTAVFLWGTLLPAEHSASRSVEFALPVQTVWHIISDFSKSVEWRRSLVTVTRRADTTRDIWVEKDKRGEMAYETIECIPPSRLVRR
ncbi:MAG TPA: hypothetical protein VF427_04570, partial [Noviherbaspirillum sp.]